MAAFDAELHLRLAAERALLDPPDPHHDPERSSPSAAAARALVAIGALSEDTAAAVLDEYTWAATLRGHEINGFFHQLHSAAPRSPAPEPFERRRVVACGVELPVASGPLRLTYVSLGADRTELGVVAEIGSSGIAHGGTPSLQLTDDTGRREQAEFAGSWSDRWLRGTFITLRGALSPTTRWIEIDGHRVELAADVIPPEVRIEPLPHADPALRHLWQVVVPDEWAHRPAPLEAAIETLVAAGALAPGDAELETIRQVHRAMTGRGGAKRELPEPWRSLRRGHSGRSDGPEGVVVVGAVTPVFDGCAVAVDALESSDEGWALAVRTTPSDAAGSHAMEGNRLRQHLTWWAADDRRHTYIGRMGSWGETDTSGSGTIHFEAPLDRKASYVDLMPTGYAHRAVIRIPLEWL